MSRPHLKKAARNTRVKKVHPALYGGYGTRESFSWHKRARAARGPWHRRLFQAVQGRTAVPEHVFGNRKAVLAISFIIILVGVFAIDQALKTPANAAVYLVTHRQQLWYDTLPSNLNDFNTLQASWVSACAGGGTVNCLKLLSNSTHAAIALSKDPVDIDTASHHELEFVNDYCFATTPSNLNIRWGYYLTRNATLPLIAGYNPRTDPNVAIEVEVQDTGSGNANYYVWIQHDPTVAINNGDNSGGTEGLGTNFMAFGGTQGTNACLGAVPNKTNMELILNFTGAASAGTKAQSTMDYGPNSGVASHSVNPLPWLQFQGTKYYMGYWMQACSGCAGVDWQAAVGSGVETPMSINRADPGLAATTPVNPTLDTGGFFGPVIKALISIGVFILQALASFFGVIYTAFRTALDTIGNFLGVGAIGTNIANALAGFSTWVVNIFGTAFTQITNAVTFLVNSLTAITNVIGTYWGQLTNFLSDLTSFLGTLWTVLSQVLKYSTIGGKIGLIIWWTIGMSFAYRSISMFMLWTRLSYMFLLYPFKFAYWLYEAVFEGIILRFKRTGFQWV